MFEKNDQQKIYEIVNPLNLEMIKKLELSERSVVNKLIDERDERIYQEYLKLIDDPEPTKLGRRKTKAVYMQLAEMTWMYGDQPQCFSFERIRRIVCAKRKEKEKTPQVS